MRCLAIFAGGRVAGLLLLAVGLCASAGMAADEQGFRAIFDGKTLDNWDGNPKLWRVENGDDHGRNHRGKSHHEQYLPDLARRQAGRLRAQGRVLHAQSGLCQLGHPDPKLGRPAKNGASPATSPTWTAKTTTPASATARIIAASSPSAARRSASAPTISRKVVEQFGDSHGTPKTIKKHDWNEYYIIARGKPHRREDQRAVDVRSDRRGHRGPQRRHHRPANSRRPADESAVPQHPAEAVRGASSDGSGNSAGSLAGTVPIFVSAKMGLSP